MKNSLEVLAGTSPKITFRTFRETHAKIHSLETALGIAPSKPILNIRAAGVRITELESKLAARNAAAVARVVAPSAAAPADYQPDPNLSADAQIAAAKAAGVVTTPGGQRLRSQRAALSADMGKLRGTSLECANQILKK
jgi:hypothetical protein